MENDQIDTLDPEIAAINAVVTAIRNLDTSTQQNVVDYVIRRFKLRLAGPDVSCAPLAGTKNHERDLEPERHQSSATDNNETGQDVLDGVSPVARKWMSRNGINAEGLLRLFSLGIDEIDLVAKKVPGKTKKARMRSVILLKGVAAYLGSGAARVMHEQVKEACLHYDAFDTDNFASYMKEMSAEVGGTKEAGYTLSARGLTAATDLVKQLLQVTQ